MTKKDLNSLSETIKITKKYFNERDNKFILYGYLLALKNSNKITREEFEELENEYC